MLLTRVDDAAFWQPAKAERQPENSRGKLKFIEPTRRAHIV